jgi:dTDP-4-dehydrorhamnose reductase
LKAIITGASGTVGRALVHEIEAQGGTAIPWKRDQTPLDDYAAMEAFVRQHQPDSLFHLAVPSQSTGRVDEGRLVNIQWTGELAWICRQLGVRFVFTSTVMVYTDHAVGPFTPDTPPDAAEGYGYEKRQAEDRAFYQNPETVVARLGWQIGEAAGSNNMIDFFERQMQEKGQIDASRRWYPACSFVADTASALIQLATMPAGLYLVNSNTRWTFDEIALALNEKHGNRWKVVPNDDFVYDQRMIDPRVPIAPLNERLPNLPGK